MWKNISTAPDTQMVLVYGTNAYGEEFYLYATKDKNTGEFYCQNIDSGLNDENSGVVLQPELWYDCPNAATYGAILEGSPDPCAAIDCGSTEPYPTDVEGCASKDDGTECQETKNGNNSGGSGGGGGSGMWSGHECGWAYQLWTLCQIGCNTGSVGGIIKPDDPCPYGKCDKNKCPCFLVGPVSPNCQ